MQSQPLGGRHLPETDATVIGIVRVQLLGLHQLSQSLLHTLGRRDIQADVQIRVERVRDTEAAETLDLRPPGPAEDLTDDGGVLGGMARRLGCTQAPCCMAFRVNIRNSWASSCWCLWKPASRSLRGRITSPA